MNFRKGHVFWECLAVAFQIQEDEKLLKNRFRFVFDKNKFTKP